MLSVLSFIFIILGFIALRFVYKFIISPARMVQYYKKQGGVGYWGFGAKFLTDAEKNVTEGRNFFQFYNDQLEKDPETKFFVHNIGHRPILLLVDPALQKDLFTNVESFHRDKLTLSLFSDLCGSSSVRTEGKAYRIKRGISSGAFNFEYLKDLVPKMNNMIYNQMMAWKDKQ